MLPLVFYLHLDLFSARLLLLFDETLEKLRRLDPTGMYLEKEAAIANPNLFEERVVKIIERRN